jgi:hypothetical protein
MTEVPPDVEQHLAAMTPEEWDVFTAKVRPPDHSEAFREVASKWISGDRLNAVTGFVRHSEFLNDDGDMDPGKVEQVLRGLFDDIPRRGPAHQNFGQYTPGDSQSGAVVLPTDPHAGQRGAAEAQKRFEGNGGYVATGKLFSHPTNPQDN